jgi:hypothetical protein
VSGDRPVLRVVSGSPTAEELAVVTAVVTAAAATAEETQPDRGRRGAWADPARQFRRQVLPGPGGWRAAAR